jgi:hypothetical protein
MDDVWVGGLIGIGGVVIGAAITWIQTARERKKQRSLDAHYLAVRVVCVLDKYIADCASAAADGGTPDSPYGQLIARVDAPEPPVYPDDVDWRCIDQRLTYEILSLPRDAQFAAEYMTSVSENATGPGDEYFEARTVKYSTLGLKAAMLVDNLRAAFNIPALDHGEWNPVDVMRSELISHEALKRRREARLLDVPPPPPPPTS